MTEPLLAGLDEVGRGPLAGPICVAVAVFLPNTPKIEGVTDSKKLSAKKRVALVQPILDSAAFIGIGWASPQHIDEHGIDSAWQVAAAMCLEHAPIKDMHLIVDGREVVDNYEGSQASMEKADLYYYPTSAASIVAKVARDLDMARMSEHYPGYSWDKNAGYGTKAHVTSIIELGPTPYHRRSFLKKILFKAGIQDMYQTSPRRPALQGPSPKCPS